MMLIHQSHPLDCFFFLKIMFWLIEEDSDTQNLKLILLLTVPLNENAYIENLTYQCQCLCAWLGT